MRYRVCGRMVEAAHLVLANQEITLKVFCRALYEALSKRQGKFCNIYVHGSSIKLWQELYSLTTEGYFQHIFESSHGLFRLDSGRASRSHFPE